MNEQSENNVVTFEASFRLRGSEVVVMEEVRENSHQQRNSHDLFDERVQLFHARHVDLTAPIHHTHMLQY